MAINHLQFCSYTFHVYDVAEFAETNHASDSSPTHPLNPSPKPKRKYTKRAVRSKPLATESAKNMEALSGYLPFVFTPPPTTEEPTKQPETPAAAQGINFN